MEKPMLTIAIDSCYKKNEIGESLKDIAKIFEIDERVYALKIPKDKTPKLVFSFGELNRENLSKVCHNIDSDVWKSASKKIGKVVKQRKKGDSILIFECNYGETKARLTCRTKDSKVVRSAMDSLKKAFSFLSQIVKSGNIPSGELQIYCGFDEKAKDYKIDRAVAFTPNYQEHVFDEKRGKWCKVNQ